MNNLVQSLNESQTNSSGPTLVTSEDSPIRSHDSSTRYKDILKSIFINSAPVFVSMVCIFSDRIYAVLLLNRKTKDPFVLAAAGLGGAWLALVSLSVFFALNAGLTSRCSQAYGAKKYRQVGLYLHRAFIINTVILVPCILLLYYSENIFELFHYDPRVAEITKGYLFYTIPGTISLMIYTTLGSVLNGCGLFKIPSMVQIVVSVFYLFFAYTFIDVWDLGLLGSAYCYCLTWTLALIILVIYLYKKDPLPGVFFAPVKESYEEVWDLFKYEAMIGCMTWVDFIAMEIMTIFTGQLAVEETASFTVAANVYRLPAPLLIAVGVTTMSFTGNAMGERNKLRAQRVLQVAAALISTFVLLSLVVFAYCKESLIRAFSPDNKTMEFALAVFNVYLWQAPAEGIQLVLANGVKAIGKEKQGSLIIALADYILAVPVAYFTCFVVKFGVRGIAMGSLAAIYGKLLMFGYLYTKIDWDLQIQVVQDALKMKKQMNRRSSEEDVELDLRNHDHNKASQEDLDEDLSRK